MISRRLFLQFSTLAAASTLGTDRFLISKPKTVISIGTIAGSKWHRTIHAFSSDLCHSLAAGFQSSMRFEFVSFKSPQELLGGLSGGKIQLAILPPVALETVGESDVSFASFPLGVTASEKTIWSQSSEISLAASKLYANLDLERVHSFHAHDFRVRLSSLAPELLRDTAQSSENRWGAHGLTAQWMRNAGLSVSEQSLRLRSAVDFSQYEISAAYYLDQMNHLKLHKRLIKSVAIDRLFHSPMTVDLVASKAFAASNPSVTRELGILAQRAATSARADLDQRQKRYLEKWKHMIVELDSELMPNVSSRIKDQEGQALSRFSGFQHLA